MLSVFLKRCQMTWHITVSDLWHFFMMSYYHEDYKRSYLNETSLQMSAVWRHFMSMWHYSEDIYTSCHILPNTSGSTSNSVMPTLLKLSTLNASERVATLSNPSRTQSADRLLQPKRQLDLNTKPIMADNASSPPPRGRRRLEHSDSPRRGGERHADSPQSKKQKRTPNRTSPPPKRQIHAKGE